MGVCFEFASIIDEKLKGTVDPIDEVHGFRYQDGKAIIGFVDGTENPAVDENPYEFAVIGDEDSGFAGGSYIFVQKYLHDMNAWNALPVEEQEKRSAGKNSTTWNSPTRRNPPTLTMP